MNPTVRSVCHRRTPPHRSLASSAIVGTNVYAAPRFAASRVPRAGHQGLLIHPRGSSASRLLGRLQAPVEAPAILEKGRLDDTELVSEAVQRREGSVATRPAGL